MANPFNNDYNESDEIRHSEQDILERDFERNVNMPPVGTLAFTARLLAECGIMSGDEADEWKDSMKDRDLFGDDF
ncbi:MAG TPA: hypothetical protein VIE65_07365 [Methylobacter sp.]|jgi:hypothetical protein